VAGSGTARDRAICDPASAVNRGGSPTSHMERS